MRKEAAGYTDASPSSGNGFPTPLTPWTQLHKSGSSRKNYSRTHIPKIKEGEEGPVGCYGNPQVVITFYLLILSHSLVPLLLSCFFLFLYFTLTVTQNSILLSSVCGLVCNLMQSEASLIIIS